MDFHILIWDFIYFNSQYYTVCYWLRIEGTLLLSACDSDYFVRRTNPEITLRNYEAK